MILRIFWTVVCCIVGSAMEMAAQETARPSSDAYHAMVAKVGEEFQALKGRVDYRLKVLSPQTAYRYDNGSSQVVLAGDALAFAERHSLHDLAAGLWSFLDDPKYAANACGILYAKTGEIFMQASGKMYMNRPETCKVIVRRAMGQPEWWYPHPILFDRETILAESKTNASLRAAHIEAMVKALADPKIRTDNPLEVNSILLILDALKAREAAQSFVDYMFYDWRAGRDYRLNDGDMLPLPRYDASKPHNLAQVQLPVLLYLPRLGDVSVPMVLRRFANATDEERSVAVGGGAATAIVIKYFMWLRFTEQQALDAIADYQNKERDLSKEQIGALGELADAIKTKKYRTDALLKNSNPIARTWAPSFTNEPSQK